MPKRRTQSRLRHAFAARLRALRLSVGYGTQESFAQALGLQGEAYRRYERGETEPSLETLVRIAELTDTSLDHLIAGRVTRFGHHVDVEGRFPGDVT